MFYVCYQTTIEYNEEYDIEYEPTLLAITLCCSLLLWYHRPYRLPQFGILQYFGKIHKIKFKTSLQKTKNCCASAGA